MKFKLFLILFFFIIRSSYGEGTYHYTDFELMMLPDFCKERQKGDEQEQRLANKGYKNMHHACKGLNHLNKALINENYKHRENEINNGIGELWYPLTANHGAGLNTHYKAFLIYNRARLYTMKGETEKAIDDFSESISLDNKLTYAYAELIELYIKKGNRF